MHLVYDQAKLPLWLFCCAVWVICWWAVWQMQPLPPRAPAGPAAPAVARNGCVVVESGTDKGIEWRKVECGPRIKGK